jgi:hypothetical protein
MIGWGGWTGWNRPRRHGAENLGRRVTFGTGTVRSGGNGTPVKCPRRAAGMPRARRTPHANGTLCAAGTAANLPCRAAGSDRLGALGWLTGTGGVTTGTTGDGTGWNRPRHLTGGVPRR